LLAQSGGLLAQSGGLLARVDGWGGGSYPERWQIIFAAERGVLK